MREPTLEKVVAYLGVISNVHGRVEALVKFV